jgi:hypothetical protein
VESAYTEPVALDGANTSVTDFVSIGLEDPVLRLSGGSRVKVTARIREEQGRKTLEGIPVEARGGTAQLRPGSIRVELTGPASVLGSLDRQSVRPYVAITRDGQDRAAVAVEVASGLAGVAVVATVPGEVVLRGARKAN